MIDEVCSTGTTVVCVRMTWSSQHRVFFKCIYKFTSQQAWRGKWGWGCTVGWIWGSNDNDGIPKQSGEKKAHFQETQLMIGFAANFPLTFV
jgi:hypothetical protein